MDREPLREPAPVTPPTQSKDLPTAAGGRELGHSAFNLGLGCGVWAGVEGSLS